MRKALSDLVSAVQAEIGAAEPNAAPSPESIGAPAAISGSHLSENAAIVKAASVAAVPDASPSIMVEKGVPAAAAPRGTERK